MIFKERHRTPSPKHFPFVRAWWNHRKDPRSHLGSRRAAQCFCLFTQHQRETGFTCTPPLNCCNSFKISKSATVLFTKVWQQKGSFQNQPSEHLERKAERLWRESNWTVTQNESSAVYPNEGEPCWVTHQQWMESSTSRSFDPALLMCRCCPWACEESQLISELMNMLKCKCIPTAVTCLRLHSPQHKPSASRPGTGRHQYKNLNLNQRKVF